MIVGATCICHACPERGSRVGRGQCEFADCSVDHTWCLKSVAGKVTLLEDDLNKRRDLR